MELRKYITKDFLYSKSSEIRKLRSFDNDKSVRILSVFTLLISTILFSQNVFLPDVQIDHALQLMYGMCFGTSAFFSGFMLAILALKDLKGKALSHVATLSYVTVLTLTTTSTTLVDFSHITDYSAYCFGLLMLPLFIRTSFFVYIFIVLLNFSWFVLGFIFVLGNEFSLSVATPIIAFSIASLGAAISVESARLKGNLLQLQLEESNRNLKELSHKDALTGLFNRRHLMESLHTLLSASKRYDFPLSVLILDLDHFKRANDSLGHQVGDKLLANIGRLLASLVRDCDVAARYGGEEFCVVLSNTNREGARFVAERIRSRIENESFDDIPWTVTASIGVATREKDESAEDFLKAADLKLYESKASGRNRVSA
ncbi:GGDEF domain-containing protein [Leptospira langatensis]|uniref:diguanylate cyclase n=1 Tax=Leptospira langatensis TaxID=2484983 RepID=A0A5F1ZQ33_9LEPT|nr:GGDEF domain-containing protein [Leptospira langatensis]TGK01937.1 GGDEF domain-containing protein [Leptospira langatensis]TGL39292.1 GGDEF domain-containing protein [Leptospira langatensis]